MAFELITGHAGRNHVDSADIGEAFAGIVGKGRYILDTGDGMACSMADSNTLTVGKGSMIMDGRIVRNETAATFKIANGTQGQYRHDLACLRYKIDRSDDSIESVEQVVLQGTPATTESEAKDPEYEAGDILSGDLSATVPIARVKLDNITPTCEAMLGSVTSLKPLGDSVSRPSVRVPVGTDGYIAFARVGRIVSMVMYEVQVTLSGSWNSKQVCAIPEGFAPRETVKQKVTADNNDSVYSAACVVDTVKRGNHVNIANRGGRGFNGTAKFNCTACWEAEG